MPGGVSAWNRRIRSGVLAVLGALSCVTFAAAPQPSISPSSPRAPQAEPAPFAIYWAGTTEQSELDQGRDWARKVPFENMPIRRDALLIYSQQLGEFPLQGPHMLLRDTQWMARHMARIAIDLDRLVPKDYSGLCIIDYSSWRPLWERTPDAKSDLPFDALDNDVQDDWRDAIRELMPEMLAGKSTEQAAGVFKKTYEAQVRDFLLPTLRECKRLRPKARWGFFGFPDTLYTGNTQTARGVFGYGDGSHLASRMNESLGWLWSEVDFLAPDLYANYFTRVDAPPRTFRENTAEENRLFITNNLAEFQRIAGSKPVFPFVWFRYHDAIGAPYALEWVNRKNLADQLELPAARGCQGVIIWDHFGGPADRFSAADLWQLYSDRMGTDIRPAIESATRTAANAGSTPASRNPVQASTLKKQANRTPPPSARISVRAIPADVEIDNDPLEEVEHQKILDALKRARAGAAPLPPPRTTPPPAPVPHGPGGR